MPTRIADLRASREQIMNLRVPRLSVEFPAEAGFGYGLSDTTGDLDRALEQYAALLPKLVKLAEMEKAVQLLAAELEKTRRRVNALEHILVPSLEETIRFISDRLSELERATATRLMKVKEIVRKH
jgi:V/A-type H+-transporting ATPase subunit D